MSEAPLGRIHYGFDAATWQLSALHEELGGGPTTWVGYSFGARLLLHFATKEPRRVARLVLESAHPGIADVQERNLRGLQDAADADLLETRGLDAFLDAWHRRVVFDSRRGTPDWDQEIKRKRRTNRPEALAMCLRGLGLSQQPDLRPLLRRIQAPTLVVAGAKDAEYAQHARDIAGLLPRARLEIVPGVGHNVHAEATPAYTKLLNDFLRRSILESAPGGPR
jgi:2-succinyl-6-hydroxy-2,4-cyclohexadiene-1-carboxylate synthase